MELWPVKLNRMRGSGGVMARKRIACVPLTMPDGAVVYVRKRVDKEISQEDVEAILRFYDYLIIARVEKDEVEE